VLEREHERLCAREVDVRALVDVPDDGRDGVRLLEQAREVERDLRPSVAAVCAGVYADLAVAADDDDGAVGHDQW
jgi:hypothetical protein